MKCPRLAAIALAGLLSPLAQDSALAAGDDPWVALRAVRDSLVAGSPLAANFTQTYVPAGFTTGERESGRLFLALPGCLRWDYEEPYLRSYLLCDQTVWAWSPDEPVGDRFVDVSREEAGLDFLLLSVDRLAERYTATSSPGPDGLVTLTLEPRTPIAAFQQASITLDANAGRPIEITYRDREGNETGFALTLFRALEDADLLSPPAGVEWVDG